jgi:outer membrane translocation and assembly module TamA
LDLYVPLQLSNRFRQTVLALDYWTSYSPTWDEQPDGEIKNRPPAYTGSTLGGIWRMRGYPSQRFNDKAAVYYSAELRIIPRWNPFNGWPWIQKYVGIQWLQFVPFVEVGRVASEWNFNKLHSDMKWDVGLGLRAWAQGIVIRIDTAVSDEQFGVQMMISQPFQF